MLTFCKTTVKSLLSFNVQKKDDSNIIKKIQVGCGPKNIKKDWINVDIRKFSGINKVMDCTKPWPWKEEVSFIYGEHFLEHLSIMGAVDFLFYAKTALKHNGKIRLTTPSLEWVVSSHFDPNEKNESKMVNQTYAINRAFHGWGHQFLYSKEYLSHLLDSVGYSNIQFYEYGKSDVNEFKSIEQHGGYSMDNKFPSVWIIEATKSDENKKLIEDIKNEINENIYQYISSGH